MNIKLLYGAISAGLILTVSATRADTIVTRSSDNNSSRGTSYAESIMTTRGIDKTEVRDNPLARPATKTRTGFNRPTYAPFR